MLLNLGAEADDDGRRLDRILRKALKDIPLSAIHRLLRTGRVQVNGKRAHRNLIIRSGDEISLNEINSADIHKNISEKKPVNNSQPKMNLIKIPEILFEGGGILVINKEPGIIVHGRDSLEEMVNNYLHDRGAGMEKSLSFKPGPLHRLDKPSSGIIVFSTSLEGARTFSRLLKERKIKKYYLAIVEGEIKENQFWQDELIRDENKKKSYTEPALIDKTNNVSTMSRHALTRVTPLFSAKSHSLIRAEIETGRTHQIRVQAASRGHSLLGDIKYGGNTIDQKKGNGFFLHSWIMEIPGGYLPVPSSFTAPLPESFNLKIIELFGKNFNESPYTGHGLT